jgi:dihydropyrimidinase
MVELVSTNPARKYGLFPLKGTIGIGSDADLAILDLQRERLVESAALHSAQDHTPFGGMRLGGWCTTTLVRGEVVYRDGQVVGPPRGVYLKRPVPARAAE